MGWIRVDRELFERQMWLEEPFTKGQAWLDLIGLANYRDGKTIYKNRFIACKRGTVNRSIAFLARRWHWSWEKTRNFLDLLESDEMIERKTRPSQCKGTDSHFPVAPAGSAGSTQPWTRWSP